MTAPKILVAGIGNIFFGDDAFGVEVAQRLLQQTLPRGVQVVDFGIRGIDLTYALMDDYDAVILVDAIPRGEQPGTVYLVEPELSEASQPAGLLIDTHDLNPEKVLHLARSLGGGIDRVLLVGCEPLHTGDEEPLPTGLSEPVLAAVDEAVALVGSLLEELRSNFSAFPIQHRPSHTVSVSRSEHHSDQETQI